MYCPACGAKNGAADKACARCGAALPDVAPLVVRSYLFPALIVSVLFCTPLGIVAVLYALRVETRVAAGDLSGAMAASRKALIWCWIGFGLGILATVVLFAASFLGGQK